MIAVPTLLLGRRGALIVAVAAGLTFLFFVGLPVAAAFEAQDEERGEAADQLAAFRAEVASAPVMQNALAALRVQAAAVPGIMRSDTDSLAEAQLQTTIKQIVVANAGDLRSAQALAPDHKNGFNRVAVQCDLTLPASHLKDLLYAIEVHAPYYFIDQVDISAPVTFQGPGGKFVEPVLEVRWTVHAYRWAQST
jgi:hypothetical protein